MNGNPHGITLLQFDCRAVACEWWAVVGAGGPGIRSLAHARGLAGLVCRRYGLNLSLLCACLVVTANRAADRTPDPPAQVVMGVVVGVKCDARGERVER